MQQSPLTTQKYVFTSIVADVTDALINGVIATIKFAGFYGLGVDWAFSVIFT
tara:strand:- start:577 stop:732 length:156 start_codon:yes stop_codon:yes gene_type:complete